LKALFFLGNSTRTQACSLLSPTTRMMTEVTTPVSVTVAKVGAALAALR
jgi:hypothetical protein